ncbi:MAG: alpha/beta hydrolase [Anaerolineales bacterium]|nr:alpha/beta hydrolase [Anaerolineales bacterium]
MTSNPTLTPSKNPTVVFAHANGYPPGTYTPLLNTLRPHFNIVTPLARPLWPNSDWRQLKDWSLLTSDLLDYLTSQTKPPIIGVGHSLGGVCLLDAALQKPELFTALVMIDPVIFRRRFICLWNTVKALGVGDRLHPLISGTLRRRRVFASPEEMFTRYRRAPVFSRVNDEGLRAYAESLARPRADGQVELNYSPEWEAAVYRTGPLNLWPQLPTLKVPALIIYAAQSDSFTAPVIKRMRKNFPQIQLHCIEESTHLVPLEKPAEVGRVTLEFLQRITTK